MLFRVKRAGTRYNIGSYRFEDTCTGGARGTHTQVLYYSTTDLYKVRRTYRGSRDTTHEYKDTGTVRYSARSMVLYR